MKKNETKQAILLYFHFAAQQVWYHAMKNLEWYIWKQKTGITFLHGILIGANLRGIQGVDKPVAWVDPRVSNRYFNDIISSVMLIGSHLWSIGGQTYRWRYH